MSRLRGPCDGKLTGGCLHDLEGRPYAPASPWQTTILASTPALADMLRRWLALGQSDV